MNPDLTPGPPEGQEPIEQLFRDVSELADETARRITDAEVDARLDRLLRKTGHAVPPAPEPDPASVLDAARRQAEEIVADARRAAAETATKAACAAQSTEEAARREAERITAEAEEYSDMALRRAAVIIADARRQAESIIAHARKQAGQVLAAARLQAGSPERQLALTATSAPDRYAAWTSAAVLDMVYAVALSDLGAAHDLLPALPAAADYHAWDKETVLSFGLHGIKFRMDAEQREPFGWMRRSWRSARSRLPLKFSSSPSPWLVVARGNGVVTGVYRGRRSVSFHYGPDDNAHVADLRAVLWGVCQLEANQGGQPASVADFRAFLWGLRQPEANQGEQPASQDGGLGGGIRSIEAATARAVQGFTP